MISVWKGEKRLDKLYIIDGYGGSPKLNWQADIKQSYRGEFDIHIVNYTDASSADVEQWDKDLDRAVLQPIGAYFICHSLGCITFLRYLLRHEVQIKGVIFVSGFARKLVEFPQFDDYMANINVAKVKHLLGKSFLLASRTDRIVDWQISNELAAELDIPFILLPDGGHFTAGEGIVTMPAVKDMVKTYWL